MAEFSNQHIDPYLCTCGPCRRFWKDTFKSSSECLAQTGEDRALESATLGKLKPEMLIAVGDRVTVHGNPGMVKFVGFIDSSVVAPVLHVGVKLDESIHMGHDGMINGKRYFFCTNGHGILVRYKDVVPLKSPPRRPPVRGNPMFPSWPEICKRRKQRETILVLLIIEEAERLEEMRKKNSKPASSPPAKTPRPPAISPRDNRAQQLRRERTALPMTSSSGFLIIKDDPYDVAYRDQRQRKKRDILVASMSTPESTQANWERGQMLKWQKKYDDPEKASRMGETLLKLCSAYKEGFKYKHTTAD